MFPAVALVGRPNVGKSTLFNRLTGSRDALVADFPGVTRDRRYGVCRAGAQPFLVIDTGGLSPSGNAEFADQIAEQVDAALGEADIVVFVVDYKDGATSEDHAVATQLRRSTKPVVVTANKSEGIGRELAEAEFHAFGLGEPVAVSAVHGHGIKRLLDVIASHFDEKEPAAEAQLFEGPRFAVIGRPNVGKSTLVNRLVRANRQLTSPEPGTTRDSIFVPCERDERRFVVIDTAGIRRRARVDAAIEKFSVVQSLQAIADASTVVVMIDATEGVTDQDLHLIGLAVEQGKALVIAINKWDGLDSRQRRSVERQAQRKLDFVQYAFVVYISALHGSGLSDVVDAAFAAHESAGRTLPTPIVNEILADAVQAHPPPIVRGRRIRLRYAHQGGRYPPLIVIHGNQLERVPSHYRRYLENRFRDALDLKGTPIVLELKSSENPFAGRRNVLTPRQRRSRERMIRHSRRKR